MDRMFDAAVIRKQEKRWKRTTELVALARQKRQVVFDAIARASSRKGAIRTIASDLKVTREDASIILTFPFAVVFDK